MKRMIITAFLIGLLAFLSVETAFSAPGDVDGKSVKLGVSFGTKSITEREYEVIADTLVSTANGQTIEVVHGETDALGSFKAEITPVLSDTNPDLIMVTVKAWEVRYVMQQGKTTKKYVLFTDEVFRVRRGFTVSSSERTVDRDVRISVTPNVE